MTKEDMKPILLSMLQSSSNFPNNQPNLSLREILWWKHGGGYDGDDEDDVDGDDDNDYDDDDGHGDDGLGGPWYR